MVILVGKVSKGTLMDQVYIPKERPIGFELGAPVLIKPLGEEEKIKPVFYNVNNLEPIKVMIIHNILNELSIWDNVILTGSFLESGFQFNDVDIILIDNKKADIKKLKENLNKIFGLRSHIIVLSYNTLIKGLESDPLYQAMLSNYVAKKKIIFRFKNKINYKLLDLHLLKSKPLIENFDYLSGSQKYDMARNMVGINLFLNNKKISKESIDQNIKSLLKETSVNIKENIINKSVFLKEYWKLYGELFSRILKGIKNVPQ